MHFFVRGVAEIQRLAQIGRRPFGFSDPEMGFFPIVNATTPGANAQMP
jgi:hypothetical protein